MVATIAAASVLLLALLAELLHARRTRRIAHLAFGPRGHARAWMPWTIPLRALAMAMLTWGLVTLYLIEPAFRRAGEVPDAALKRLLIVLDVSPSMQLKDAGEKKDQSRARRAADVVMSVLDRVSLEQSRVSIVAFYTGARPVVIDTRDPAVVKNVMADLPLDFAFDPGKTAILDGITEACTIAKPWREKSATLLIVSDGDSVPYTGMPTLPPSIARTLVVGVGDATVGKFIDDHNSRQDTVTLRQLAARMHGSYHDANGRNVPGQLLAALSGLLPIKENWHAGAREAAIVAVALGGLIVSVIPVALVLFGTNWRPGARASARAPARGVTIREVPSSLILEGAGHA